MIKFLDAKEVGKQLKVSQDQVRHLIRQNRLRAKKIGGPQGDYLIHPVDVARLNVVRSLHSHKQLPLAPDVIWIVEACNFLMQMIEAASFQPELIVGIAFGGLFPASFISSTLRIPHIPLRVKHYDGQVPLPEAQVLPYDYRFRNMPILVVDDIVDTGDTLVAVNSYLVDKCGVEVANLRFATLHKKLSAAFEPNWYVDVVKGWVCYPWEVQDDQKQFH